MQSNEDPVLSLRVRR